MPENFILVEKLIISCRLTIPGGIRLRARSTRIRLERYRRHEADQSNRVHSVNSDRVGAPGGARGRTPAAESGAGERMIEILKRH